MSISSASCQLANRNQDGCATTPRSASFQLAAVHLCPALDCPCEAPDDQLLCDDHEQIVPVELLYELDFAWGNFQWTLHRRLRLKECIAAAIRYHRARRAVIDAAGQL